ncbi:type II secretion system minor pseudopilin GspK [Haliea sp. E17]|uniref:type II secretion system minor pseudopilin GspK n=1 Tax=Haliea sp. E17 TaxID=3401576 RepID=UPI003AAD98AD
MYCPRSSPPARQRGAALILALLIFAISAALIVAMRANFDRVYQQASSLFIAEQSRAYLRGAEGLATLALQVDYDADKGEGEDRRDTLDDFWARKTVPYALDEGWLSGGLEDLQGRFNLNLLVEEEPDPEQQEGPRFTVPQAQFVRLVLAVTDPAPSESEALSLARSIGDWVDQDTIPRPDGAEDDFYLSREPAYRAANRPLQAVSELRAIKGVTPELYAALEPWVTVWPQENGRLNIETAPVTVLRSLGADDSLQPLSHDEALSLAQLRCDGPFDNVEAFLLLTPFGSGEETNVNGIRELLGQQSAYFLLRAEAEVAGRQRRLYSVLQRQNRQVSILSRTIDQRVTPPELKREDPCER